MNVINAIFIVIILLSSVALTSCNTVKDDVKIYNVSWAHDNQTRSDLILYSIKNPTDKALTCDTKISYLNESVPLDSITLQPQENISLSTNLELPLGDYNLIIESDCKP